MAIKVTGDGNPEQSLKGIYVFPPTPISDGKFNEPVFQHLLDSLIEEGNVHGVATLGSTGNGPAFAEEERKTVIKASVEAVKRRVPVIVGTGTITTASTIALSQYAAAVGADGVLVVPHSYWKPTQDELYLHYKTVAESVSLPLVVYNNPATTGVDILPSLVAKLSRIENVVAIKESSGNVGRVEEIRLLCDDDFTVFCGDETLSLPSFCMGADGWFTATANIIPRACVELYELVVEREELASARQLYDKMIPLMRFLGRTGLIRSVMTALPMMGHPVGEPQAPIQLLGDDDRAELKQLLQSWELL